MNVSTLDNLKTFVTLEPLQIYQINEKGLFPKDSAKIEELIPPLVSAEIESEGIDKVLKIRITAFITTKYTGVCPQEQLKLSTQNIKGSLQVLLSYNCTDVAPESYNAWYLCFYYPLKDEEIIEEVITSIQDTDPKTSRGTTTIVQHG